MSEELKPDGYKTENDTQLPEILYHYTTVKGLKGIIEKKYLWMTDYRYMNDAQEFRYGVSLFLNTLLSKEQVINFSEAEQNVSARDLLESIILKIAFQHPAFITCFSEKKDQLDLWRGYGKKGGYALGIKTNSLKNNMVVPVKVDYTDDCFQQDNSFKDIEKLSDFLQESFINKSDFMNRLASEENKSYLLKPLGYCNLVKHSGFVNENEWRVFTLLSPKLNQEFLNSLEFFPNTNLLKPIMHLSINTDEYPDWLDSITVGPMAHQELAKTSLEMFLKSQNLEQVKVICSEIPYREF